MGFRAGPASAGQRARTSHAVRCQMPHSTMHEQGDRERLWNPASQLRPHLRALASAAAMASPSVACSVVINGSLVVRADHRPFPQSVT